jgi:hypothetical protein
MLHRIRHELGLGRALANARRETDELERTLAAVDAVVARVTAQAIAHAVTTKAATTRTVRAA